MGKTLTCPQCGNRGDSSDDVHFEVRGQHQGRMVRKCLQCGAGVYVKMLGRAELIAPPVWERMQEMWEEEFGTQTATTQVLQPALRQAAEAIDKSWAIGELEVAEPALDLFSSAAGVLADSEGLDVIERETEDWGDGLTDDEAVHVAKVAVGIHCLLFMSRPENIRLLAERLDVRPSETADELWRIYLNDFLTPGERQWVQDLRAVWVEDDKARFSIAATRALRQAAGFDPQPDVEESMLWANLFSQDAAAVARSYASN